MRFASLATLVAMTIVTGCGSSHQRAGSRRAIEIHLPTIGFTHPAAHRHSVQQIEAAFASQGIQLHKVNLPQSNGRWRLTSGMVLLRYGSRTNFVTVAVPGPEPRGTFEFLGTDMRGSPRPRIARHGDIFVFYDPVHSAAVKSALAELR